ncbi:MAG: hypothetical protein M5U35_04275 [Roseovarius sp.]|nr:hypothetical protein [Roseovarius sp.]
MAGVFEHRHLGALGDQGHGVEAQTRAGAQIDGVFLDPAQLRRPEIGLTQRRGERGLDVFLAGFGIIGDPDAADALGQF